MPPLAPFGDRQGGRLHRLLVYFGLRDAPEQRETAVRRPPPADTATPASGSRETSRLDNALVYFGLADGPDRSRYGTAVSRELDADIDELRRRLDALEGRRRG